MAKGLGGVRGFEERLRSGERMASPTEVQIGLAQEGARIMEKVGTACKKRSTRQKINESANTSPWSGWRGSRAAALQASAWRCNMRRMPC
eukprot:2271656-Pyramimonas_sp.AAC.1